jgi:hypothetical protein
MPVGFNNRPVSFFLENDLNFLPDNDDKNHSAILILALLNALEVFFCG